MARETREEPVNPLARRVSTMRSCRSLSTPTHKGVLETEEIKQVGHERTGSRVVVAGVGLAVDEAVLKAEEVEEVEHTSARGLVTVGVAGGHAIEEQHPHRAPVVIAGHPHAQVIHAVAVEITQ